MARRPRKLAAQQSGGRRSNRRAPSRSAVASQSRAPLHNLPAQLTSFIGREQEIADVQRLLEKTRLLTLTGSGGCGKTRLALKVAGRVLKRHPDGVWFVDLAPLSDPAVVPQAVALAAGAPDQPGRPLLDVLRDYLHARRVLLVIDNCEHVISGCASLIETLLKGCPGLRVLATSRQALDVNAERAWRVPSLPVPEPEPRPTSVEISDIAAVRLFVERASMIAPTFSLTKANADAVVEICRRLDGIPLAIELAAARVKMFTPGEIVSRLREPFRLLVGSSRSAVPRQQTMGAVIDWSYALLPLLEQTVLRRFAVFAGGAMLEAAVAVCTGDDVPESAVEGALTHLVDQSLVLAEPHGEVTRYRLLGTTRQFAFDRLEASGELAAARLRHSDWYVSLAEQASAVMFGPDLPAWLARLDAEYENLRSALAWETPDAVDRRARLTDGLKYFWFLRGDWTEARRWMAVILGERHRVPRAILLRVLAWATVLANQQGEYDTAMQLVSEGLALEEENPDMRARGLLMYVRAGWLSRMTNMQDGAAEFEEAARLSEAAGDKWLAAAACANICGNAAWAGDHGRARAFGERGLTLARDVGDPWVIGMALRSAGLQSMLQGDLGRAAGLVADSLACEHGRLGYRYDLGLCFMILASLACSRGDFAVAARLVGAADVNQISEYVLGPGWQRIRAHSITAAREAIGTEGFDQAYAEGRGMTLEQTAEYAIAAAGAFVAAARAGDKPTPRAGAALLTARQRDVAALIAQGLSNREIAARLVVSERTAETHVQNILNKLGVGTRTQIGVWAAQHTDSETT